MAFVPRFLRFAGYETTDVQTSLRDHTVYVRLFPQKDKPFVCCRCGQALKGSRGSHRLALRELPLRGFTTIVRLWRRKGDCAQCKKVRSEHIPFIAKESPHFTQDYAWWLGTVCEFSPVSRVAELAGLNKMTVRRLDFKRMRRMLKHYKIPAVSRIAVDEVYARRKKKHADEDRDQRFFTVITDLETRRVIWVGDSRKKEALDTFFKLLGEAACRHIEVVATDQHDGYRASVREHCPHAKVVWDKFHILKGFEEAVNAVRKTLHERLPSKSQLIPLTRGRYRFAFLKKACRREAKEKARIDEVVAANKDFAALELIKERMLSFFDSLTETDAWECFREIGRWIDQKAREEVAPNGTTPAFAPLQHWWQNLASEWGTLKNYFTFRVTSGLAEGINNVIKALKRRSFGFRNMEYFRLKIMQVCGYLNSQSIKFPEALGT